MNAKLGSLGLRSCDLFCGAGGWTEGLRQACEEEGISQSVHICVNHWDIAIDSHSRNHPYANHVCDSLNKMNPKHAGKLHAVIASPECTHFSVARGAAPINDQRRVPAGSVADWIYQCQPEFFCIENVKEFENWGPLYPDDHPVKKLRGKPVPEHKGEDFMKFVVDPIRNLGYSVEWRVLNCADFGDPTTRQRLFILGRRDGCPVEWPEPTHDEHGRNGLPKWIPAKSIIDWSIPACSIFASQEEAYAWAEFHGIPKNQAPRRPLVQKTLDRIAHGFEKYGGEWAEPFLCILKGQSMTRDLELPCPTMTTRQNLSVAVPFMMPQQQGWDGKYVRGIDNPLQTITTRGCEYVVHPMLLQQEHGGRLMSPDNPMNTITASSRYYGLIEPFLTKYHGGESGRTRSPSINDPMATVDCANRFGLVEPFLTKLYGTGKTSETGDPLDTVTAGGYKFGLIEPFMVEQNFRGANGSLTRGVDRPTQTLLTKAHVNLCQPFMTEYYGSGSGMQGQSIDRPMPTVTCRDRFGVVTQYGLDILYRMLQPHELAAAMGFPAHYRWKGNKGDIVRQIGNAVPVGTSKAILKAMIKQTSVIELAS